jgi:hypothetical protein
VSIASSEVTIPRAWLTWSPAERAAWWHSLSDEEFALLDAAVQAELARRHEGGQS